MNTTRWSKLVHQLPESPRILITRLSAVGDCIHTMPLVGALRRKYPKAFIAWATQRGPATLLEGYPGLDEVIVVPRDWLKSLNVARQVRQTLRQRRFQVTVDPQSLTKSALLGWLSGASIRVGFAKPQGRELSCWLNNVLVRPTADHVVDKYLQAAGPLVGQQQPTASFEFPTVHSEAIESFVTRTHLQHGFAVINPGAGWDSKLWLPERFARVARHLGDKYQLPTVVVWAGDREETWADSIVAHAGGHAWKAPDTTLPQLAELLRLARICVASDTGPLHLAAAVGTPCVALFGPTLPTVCGPYGDNHRSVQAYYQDGPGRRRADNLAMQAIEADTVIAACDEVLATLSGTQAA